METPRFSVFEAIVYAFKTVLDNIRLFFFTALAKLAFFFIFFGIFGIFSVGIFKKLWGQWPQLVELFKCDSIETCKASWEQLSGTLSGLITQYAIGLGIFVLVLIFLGIGIYLGFIRLVLKLHDTGSSSVKLLFSCFGLAPKALISTILYGLMVFVGFIAFIIPGIYLMLRGFFFPYFIVDKNAGIIDSIKRSFAITRGQVWPLFAISMIVPLMVKWGPAGIFILTPLMTVALVYAYRKLSVEIVKSQEKINVVR